MPSYKEFYGSKMLSAKTLGKRTLKGKIIAVGPETMDGKDGKQTTRLCLTLLGEDKMIPLNASNAERLGKKWGENFDKWKNRSVTVTVTKTTYQGSEVDGLLVSPL